MQTRANSAPAVRAQAVLARVRDTSVPLDDAALRAVTIELASALQAAVEIETTRSERARAHVLSTLVADPDGQAFTTLLTDRVYRSQDPARIVDAARHLLRTIGIPGYLPMLDRAKLRALLHAGPFMPEAAARGVLGELRAQTKHVVLSAEPPVLARHLETRTREGIRVNVNQLGEAVLGEQEAAQRLREYLELLARPEVQAISVKLSSIVSRVDVLSFEQTLEEARPRLREIYRSALEHGSKVVSLDMEAYRDLPLTLELFMRLLDEDALRGLRAGIVLQAYLPDSLQLQRMLTSWAMQRVAAGGAPVRLRIVKGANLAAERAESSARGWPLPMFGSKAEVDASYKNMLEHACVPAHALAVEIGVASHNVFDIAFALVLRAKHGVEAQVGFELLEGMADPLARTLRGLGNDTLVYCPAALPDAMQSAIAYLMRRLDENTSEQNFLRNSFGMHVGDAAWIGEQARFEDAYALRVKLDQQPKRMQDRRVVEGDASDAGSVFRNEADTDFSLAANRAWITEVLNSWRTRDCFDVPFQIGGQSQFREPCANGFDPSRPGHVPYRFALANAGDIARALETAERAARKAASVPVAERCALLGRIATGLRAARGQLIAAMLLDAGKRVDQADAEVSEAIDFAEYYRRSLIEHGARLDLRLSPKGTVLVTPPWNFPLAIPAGGVLAALVTGNAVLLKPALETVLVAHELAKICWSAGVDAELLQLVLCEDEIGSRLIRDARVNAVVLTGATSTAELFRKLRPGLDLLAETGGKNAIVITAMADHDQAIKDALQAAFGHAGQKCSATSLLVCEAEVYHDAAFRRVLADAAASLPVGSAWDLRSVVTPLIRPPEGALQRALSSLEPGESWLLQPKTDVSNPRLVSPGVKLDVPAGGFTHTTELFGPLLGVLCAKDLDHAIELVNATPYGLTSGLFSLDEREQLRWSERVHAGNLYVNRGTTGAIVQRQPFGGFKASGYGAGAKAGGPNYVLGFCNIEPKAEPSALDAPLPDAAIFLAQVRRHVPIPDHRRLAGAACTYAHAYRSHFGIGHDPSHVLGELNMFRYLPVATFIVRASHDGILGDALLACVAGLTAGAKVVLSMDPALLATAAWFADLPLVTVVAEDAVSCGQRLHTNIDRVRQVGSLEAPLAAAASAAGVHIAREPVLLNGRIELLHCLREQSLSVVWHRNGSLDGRRLLPWAVPE